MGVWPGKERGGEVGSQRARVSHVQHPAGPELGRETDPEQLREANIGVFRGGASGPPAEREPAEHTGESVLRREQKQKEATPFVLGEALPVVPAKLVKRILRGEYIDMAELLRDNMEAERRRAAVESETGQGQVGQRIGRREIPDIMSWVQCFSAYAAVLVSKYPEKAKELLAYQTLMVGKHRRCGGRGWLRHSGSRWHQ